MSAEHEGYAILNCQMNFPFCMIITGSSGAGKSVFANQFIMNFNRLVDTNLDYCCWFHGIETHEIKNSTTSDIRYVQGLPEDLSSYIIDEQNGLFVFDDLQYELLQSKQVAEFCQKTSHHRNVAMIIILQDAYAEGPYRKSLMRSTHFFVLFPNFLDNSVTYSLASKILPRDQRTFFDIYEHCTSLKNKNYGYLFISGQPKTPYQIRFRTDIFGPTQTCLIPRKWLVKK